MCLLLLHIWKKPFVSVLYFEPCLRSKSARLMHLMVKYSLLVLSYVDSRLFWCQEPWPRMHHIFTIPRWVILQHPMGHPQNRLENQAVLLYYERNSRFWESSYFCGEHLGWGLKITMMELKEQEPDLDIYFLLDHFGILTVDHYRIVFTLHRPQCF